MITFGKRPVAKKLPGTESREVTKLSREKKVLVFMKNHGVMPTSFALTAQPALKNSVFPSPRFMNSRSASSWLQILSTAWSAAGQAGLALSMLTVLKAGESGKLTRDVWNGIDGSSLETLTSLARFHGGADSSSLIPGAVAPSNAGNNYGSRLRGYIIAPVTGDYTFWEAGDDDVELRLSGTPDKFAAKRIAGHVGWTNPLDWDKFVTQQSGVVRLAAGQKYFVELRHKDGTGADHAAMAWSYTEVQEGVNLARLGGATATQSSDYNSLGVASKAIDGDTSDIFTETHNEPSAWWQVDLGTLRSVDRLVLWNRLGYNGLRLSNFRISLLDSSGATMLSKDFHTNGTHAGDKLEWIIPGAVNAQTVKIQLLGPSANGEQILSLSEVEVFGNESAHAGELENLARIPGALATQSSTYGSWIASNAVDGDLSGNTANGGLLAHTQNGAGAWWKIDLGAIHRLESVKIWNREGYNGLRLSNFRLSLLDDSGTEILHEDFHTDGTHAGREFDWNLATPLRARTVKLELLGPSANGEQIINLAEVQVFGESNRLSFSPRQIIPSAYLESYDIQANDLDDDDLLDVWEVEHGFNTNAWENGTRASGADADGDYIPNLQESEYGLNPFSRESLPGHLTHEQWYGLAYGSLREAAAKADEYYQPGDKLRFVSESGTGLHETDALGQRLRGYIQAPVTGNYHFWISATNGAQLLLSEVGDKFHKRIIAEMGAEAGTGYGVYYYDPLKWDSFASQMSEPVRLEAGKKYFLEVRHQHLHWHYPHAEVAWAVPSGDREMIPSGSLFSYFPLAEDTDDDSLPDAWEIQYGLDASENGLHSRIREGEHGDFDGDGLTNHEEYLAGTNPAEIDSDGDGLSDKDELRNYGTNPNVSDASPEMIVQTVDPAAVVGLGSKWLQTPDGVMTASFRGSGSWDFETTRDGFWIIQIEGKLRGNLRAEEILPVDVKINGSPIGRQKMTFINGSSGSLRVITPWLPMGSHRIDAFFDNYMARRVVEITGVKVVEPGGVDLDLDSRSDALVAQLKSLNRIRPGTATVSHISPAFIEGSSRSPEIVEFRYSHQGAGTTTREATSYWSNAVPGLEAATKALSESLALDPAGSRDSAGSIFPAVGGPGNSTWFVKLPLNPNRATSYATFHENGGISDSGVVTWQPLNVFDVDQITVPVGSTLLMGAWVGDLDGSIVDVTMGAETLSMPASGSLARLFDATGTQVVTVGHRDSNQTRSLVVHVKDASLPSEITLEENRFRTVALADVPSDLSLDAHGELIIGGLNPAMSGGSSVRLSGLIPGTTRMAARVSREDAILDQAEVTVVGLSDALRNQTITAAAAGDGTLIVRSPLLVTSLPVGATVRISIFGGGATFLDGTTVKILALSDFDEDGVYLMEMLMPAERLGAPCHTIEIFDANGTPLEK